MSDNPLPQLREYGQSLWLEDLTREILRDGTLARRVAEDGLAGVRPDPNRLQEAIACGDCYDERIAELAREGRSPAEIHETLVLEDVQAAADLLRPVYEDSDGEDGFVSFGVSPHLARDPEGTVEQAQALLVRIRRPNVLIEIPGTPEALPAIETGLTEGIQVNATLLFSVDRYRRVLDAWLRSIETRRDRGEPLGVRSVASFSLGPLDAKVDALLDECKTGCEDSSGTEQLRGRAARATARAAYCIQKELLAKTERRWAALAEAGAVPQKLLWASAFSGDPGDTGYLEDLIGSATIAAVPPRVLRSFRERGKLDWTLEQNVLEQFEVLQRLAASGIDLEEVADELIGEGVDRLVGSFDAQRRAIEEKSRTLAG